ncbi:MAG TPA: recombinase family protein [Nitrospira sp.]|jgi:site-specific DNA recombinase|nr:recombinase family protein [Nitrospira sp.]
MLHAALYLRVSSAKQEEGSSLETQEAGCRAYAAERGYTIDESHVYQDIFTGIELWERPQLTRLREAIRRQQIAVVICYAIDRMARDPVHLGVVLSEADHKDVRVEFVTEVIDDSPEGQLIRFVRGYAAKVEHEKIRERSIRGKRARVLSGKLVGGAPELYGYHMDRERGIRTINESEALVVRRIYHDYVIDCASMNEIARRLNADDVPSPTAGKREYRSGRIPRWNQQSVRYILLHEAYIGESYAWKWRTTGKTRVVELRPRHEWIALPEGTTPPIVPKGWWDEARRKLETNRGEHARNRQRPALLRGLIFCAVCGHRMWVDAYHQRLYYRCPSKTVTGTRCGSVIVQAKLVEDAAWSHVRDRILDPGLIERDLAATGADVSDTLAEESQAISRRLSQIVRGQERLLARYSDAETIPWELVEREINRAEDEKTSLRAQLADLEARRSTRDASQRQQLTIADWCTRVARNLDSLTFDERRQVLEILALRVMANGANYTFTLDPQVF